MDLEHWITAGVSALITFAITVTFLRNVVAPKLRDLSELTTATWDDDLIDAVDTALAHADRYVGVALTALGRQQALEDARKEALRDLDIDTEGDDDA